MIERPLSEKVIGCAIEVSRRLGHGFLERVYESSLAIELEVNNVPFQRQLPVSVEYRGKRVGEYACDFLVAERLLLEIKALAALTREHQAQVMNYLRATRLSAALLLNFGTPRLQVRRIVLDHDDAVPI